MQLQQLAPRHPLDVPKPEHWPAMEKSLGIGTRERMDHG
jgi:hypothetical protein